MHSNFGFMLGKGFRIFVGGPENLDAVGQMMSDKKEHPERGTSESNRNTNTIHGVERSDEAGGPRAYQDPAVLRELYHEREWTQAAIAEEFGVSQMTISNWMDRLGVESRLPMHKRDPSISKSEGTKHRIQYKIPDGDGGRENFYRYQLVALLCEDDDGEWTYSIDDIFGDGGHVHHELSSFVAIDIPENLAVLSPSEHTRIHGGYPVVSRVEAVLGELFDDYDGEPNPDELENPLAASMDDGDEKMEKLKQWRDRFGVMAD